MDLLREVKAYIVRHQLLEPDARVVVGVSGGPDSIALLHLLTRLDETYRPDVHVAHLNHGIRGEAADEDQRYVEALAEAYHLPCTIARIDVPALAREQNLALEEAARQARYGFLARVADQIGARHIAVGHHGDDQAETVLMHLLRGAGPAGLRGMLPATPMRDYRLLPPGQAARADLTLIRPLLGIPREAIEAYCEREGLSPRFDRSNLDTTYFRNQLRHEVLPYLAGINPRISERLRNLAEVVRADYELLQEFVGVAIDTLVIAVHSDTLTMDLARWREQPLAVQRAVIRWAAYQLRRTLRNIDFEHIEQAVEIARDGQTGARAVLPHGLELTVGYTTLTISEADAVHLPSERPWLEPGQVIPVDIPGVTLLRQGWSLHAREVSHWDLETIAENPNPLAAWIDANALGARPALRTRETGDRFRPQGLRGAEVRLSDFLINTKVPRTWRDHLPLLVSGEQILWVAGIRVSEKALIKPDTSRVIHLRFSMS